jgi:hypothetical protein
LRWSVHPTRAEIIRSRCPFSVVFESRGLGVDFLDATRTLGLAVLPREPVFGETLRENRHCVP